MKQVILISNLILIFLLLISNISECKINQNIIYVAQDGEKDFACIQDAINNATDNDIIQVLNGNYNECIYVNKSVTIKGEDKNSTILRGTICILADKVELTKFTINNNYSKNGINIISNQNTIRENTIKNCNIGINISKNKSLIYHNNFINNTRNVADSGKNTWYNKTLQQGNYWDDYGGKDENLDGIGDAAYKITESDAQDKYPLMMRYEEFLKINEQGFNLDELSYVLVIGGIISVIVLVPIAYYFRKKILKL